MASSSRVTNFTENKSAPPCPPLTRTLLNEEKRNYLVIACGKKCSCGHPTERWASLDISPRREPDILLSVDAIPFDITKTFKLVYVEGISAGIRSTERFSRISTLVHPQGALFIVPAGHEIMNNARENNFSFDLFLVSKGRILLVRDRTQLENIMNCIHMDLTEAKTWGRTLVNSIKLLSTSEIFKEIDSILICIIAHVQTYVVKRELERGLLCRSFWKDQTYREMLKDVETSILELHHGKKDVENLIKKLDEWKAKLPSTKTEHYKLNYDPLDYVLDTCVEALRCYQMKKLSPTVSPTSITELKK